MPLIKISMFEGRAAQEKQEVAKAVHDALIEAFRIPLNDTNIRIEEYKAEDWLLPPGKSTQYVLTEISAFSGRSADAKRLLYKAIVRNLGSLGIVPGNIFILLYEEPPVNWGIRGGIAACDIDLGFDINV